MKKAFIKAISYYLPENTLSNDDINSMFPQWSVDKISAKTGIYNRHIAAVDQTSVDMGIQAAHNLFAEHNIEKSNIDFLIFCTQSPDYFLPTSACIMQDAIGLPTQIGAIDINMGCSGYIYGLSLAKGLILSGVAKNILFITSETYTKYIHPKDKSNRTIFGDAATATLIVDKKEGSIGEICNTVFETDGRGHCHLIVRNGAARTPVKNGEDVYDEDQGYLYNDNNLFMNGKEIFNFTATQVPRLVKNIIEKNELTSDQIDLYVFHQANAYMMDFIRKRLNIDKDKFYIHLKDVGNTVSSTIPIALCAAQKASRLRGNVILAGFGVGLSMGATVIKCH